MGLNAKNIKTTNSGGNHVQQEPIEAGTYPARVVQVIDLGVQEQKPFQGKDKPPVQMIMVGYELTDEFCKDENGKDVEDKPRWISEEFPLYSLQADKAKSTLRYNAIDPTDSCDGDFTRLVGLPCLLTIIKRPSGDRVYNNVHSVSTVRQRDADRMPQLVNTPKVFLLDEPDMEVFGALPQWLQEKIKKNLHYKGSVLERALSGKVADNTKETSEEVVDEDKDW